MCAVRCTTCRPNSPPTTALPPMSRPWATSWGRSGRAARFLIRRLTRWCGSPQHTRACRPDRARERDGRQRGDRAMQLAFRRMVRDVKGTFGGKKGTNFVLRAEISLSQEELDAVNRFYLAGTRIYEWE